MLNKSILARLAVCGLAAGLMLPAAGSLVHAQQAPAAKQSSGWDQNRAASSGALSFESETIDFGEAKEGDKVDVRFNFKNVSDKVITITNIRTSCGCTAPKLDKKQFAPGETDTIVATFNTTGRTDRQTSTVTVETDDPDKPRYMLRLSGIVKSDVYLSERSLDFGLFDAGERQEHTFYVYNFGEEKTGEVTVASAVNGLETTVGEAEEYTNEDGQTGERIPITIAVPADYAPGNLSGAISVRHRIEGGRVKALNLFSRGEARGEVSISPSIVSYGIMMPGQEAVRRPFVTTRSGEPFVLDSYEVQMNDAQFAALRPELRPPLPEFDLKVEADPNNGRQTLVTSIKAPDRQFTYRGSVIVYGTVGDKPVSLSVPFSSTVRQTQPNPNAEPREGLRVMRSGEVQGDAAVQRTESRREIRATIGRQGPEQSEDPKETLSGQGQLKKER